MIRLVKTIRSEYELRGYFSYLTEAVIEIMWAEKMYPNEELKVYFDLTKVHHYKQENLFDVCFEQDHDDYNNFKNEYKNIESLNSEIRFNHYELSVFPQEIRNETDPIIKKYFLLKPHLEIELNERLQKIDLKKTISVHRRDTDMKYSHHITAPVLNQFFNLIEETDYSNVFVMSDNKPDLELFHERYGDRCISFEEDTTSENLDTPFFLNENNTEEKMKRHIENLTLNTIILSRTKKLICSKSNLSTFAILANPNLEYIKLN